MARSCVWCCSILLQALAIQINEIERKIFFYNFILERTIPVNVFQEMDFKILISVCQSRLDKLDILLATFIRGKETFFLKLPILPSYDKSCQESFRVFTVLLASVLLGTLFNNRVNIVSCLCNVLLSCIFVHYSSI